MGSPTQSQSHGPRKVVAQAALWASTSIRLDLLRLLEGLRQRLGTPDPPRSAELEALASELNHASDVLDECAVNCHAAADALRLRAGATDAGLQRLEGWSERLSNAVGRPVILTQAAVKSLLWRRALLMCVNGTCAIVRERGRYWEAPISQIMVIPSDTQKAEWGPPEELEHSDLFLRTDGPEVANVIQFLTMTPRTGEAQLRFAASRSNGSLFFEKGQVSHIEFGQTVGVYALACMLRQGSAELRFLSGRKTASRTMSIDTDKLLLMAAVLADELLQEKNVLPSS